MAVLKRVAIAAALLAVAGAAWYVAPIWREISMMCREDPAIWEETIAAFEASDAAAPPRPGSVLFVGSSSIRLWDSLQEDMAPLPVIGRGFGGAKVNDVLVYADRLITPYEPAAVVIFVGGNDVADVACNEPKSAKRVAELTRELIDRIHARLPGTPVYYLALTPSARDEADSAGDVNERVRGLAASDEWLSYIDANGPVTGADGRVPAELLKRDGIHLNRAGYALWAQPIRERLLADLPSLAH